MNAGIIGGSAPRRNSTLGRPYLDPRKKRAFKSARGIGLEFEK
jgi:hypothetical protein